MAIFLGNIKGVNANGASELSGFTYIKWNYASEKEVEGLPEIFMASENIYDTTALVPSDSADNYRYFGHILVDNTDAEQTIPTLHVDTVNDYLSYDDDTGTMTTSASLDIQGSATVNNLTCTTLGITNAGTFTASGSAIFNNTTAFNNTVTINSNSTLSCGDSVIYNDHIETRFFNATSDRRLKTNLKPLDTVLPFINSVPVYSFNYKATDLPAIGIMAQDVDNVYFDQFKLTDCSADDVLSIHESKLVYILGKGMQEQQAQIDKLKEEIESLRGGK